MLRTMLHAKLHHAVVTRCDAEYVGSITIDENLLEASGLRPNEKVLVLDVDNAARFETYVIRGERGSGEIGINGPAAHLTELGHRVIVLSFAQLTEDELEDHAATVVICDADNRIAEARRLPSRLDEPAYLPA